MLRTGLLSVVLAGGMVVPLAMPATASDVVEPWNGWITHKAPMAGVTDAFWNELVGPTTSQWFPKGRRIAGLKFDPRKNGFFFFNYGNTDKSLPNRLNNYIFDTSASPVRNLGTQQMVNIFGRAAVCQPSKNKCTLTGAAKTWMDSVNLSSNGGHCFGMATTAAQIYANVLKPSQLGGKKNTHSIPFVPKATAMIAQNFSLQATEDLTQNLTPSQAFKVLKASLSRNQPMVMAIHDSSGGGHAINPIGLYQRGKNKYDIEVYDNNYPDRVRVVHANMSKQPGTKREVGFDYDLFTMPGSGAVKLAGNIGLIPLSELTGRKAAPFDLGAERATVTIAPVKTDVPLTVKITKPDGKPIKGLKVHRPLEELIHDGQQVFPRYTLPKNTAFKLVIDNANNPVEADTSVTLQSGYITAEINSMNLPAHTVDSVTYKPSQRSLTYRSSEGTDPYLNFRNTLGYGREAAAQIGSVDLPPGGGFTAKFDSKAGAFSYQPFPGSAGTDTVKMMLEQVSSPKSNKTVMAYTDPLTALTLPANGYVKWNYLQGDPGAKQMTVNLVSADGTATPVVLAAKRQVL